MSEIFELTLEVQTTLATTLAVGLGQSFLLERASSWSFELDLRTAVDWEIER